VNPSKHCKEKLKMSHISPGPLCTFRIRYLTKGNTHGYVDLSSLRIPQGKIEANPVLQEYSRKHEAFRAERQLVSLPWGHTDLEFDKSSHLTRFQEMAWTRLSRYCQFPLLKKNGSHRPDSVSAPNMWLPQFP